MTYISWSIEFALYLEDYLMDEYISQYDPTFVLNVNIGQHDLYFTVQTLEDFGC